MSSQDVKKIRDPEKFNVENKVMGGDWQKVSDPGAFEANRLFDKWQNKYFPDPAASGAGAPAGSPPADPAVQFDTRRQEYADQARAAGAQRTGNDADLLGFGVSRRRAGQARRILG
jgi:hypothetical protein